MSLAKRRVVALYRSPLYSPNQHRSNDVLILDATVARLRARGWTVRRASEQHVARGEVPPSDWYLNMCQGPDASERLARAVGDDTTLVNHPMSVLACHRHHMVPALTAAGVAFPETALVDVRADALPVAARVAGSADGFVWVKRGDVHAQTSDDVVRVTAAEVPAALAAFAARGVRRVALQRHVPGPVIKFYAVNHARFFRWFRTDGHANGNGHALRPDEARLRELAFQASDALGLEVFGGDIVLPAPDAPVLVDINDWPSFAPCRDEAAEAIASYVDERARAGGIR